MESQDLFTACIMHASSNSFTLRQRSVQQCSTQVSNDRDIFKSATLQPAAVSVACAEHCAAHLGVRPRPHILALGPACKEAVYGSGKQHGLTQPAPRLTGPCIVESVAVQCH